MYFAINSCNLSSTFFHRSGCNKTKAAFWLFCLSTHEKIIFTSGNLASQPVFQPSVDSFRPHSLHTHSLSPSGAWVHAKQLYLANLAHVHSQRCLKKKNYHLKYPQTERVLWCLHLPYSNTVWSYNRTWFLISDFTMFSTHVQLRHISFRNLSSHSSSALRNFISSPWRSLPGLMEVCPPQSCNLYCVWVCNCLRNEQVWQDQETIRS